MTYEERQARRITKRQAKATRRNCTNRGWVGGIILIGLGSILFLDNLGILSSRDIWGAVWPGLLIWFGLSRVTSPCRPGDQMVGGIATGLGVMLLLATLGVFPNRYRDDGHWIFAVLLILGGAVAMQRAIYRPEQGPGQPWPPNNQPFSSNQNWSATPGNPQGSPTSADTSNFWWTPNPPDGRVLLNEHVFAGNKKARFESGEYLGGEIHCYLGEIQLDLTSLSPPAKAQPTVFLEVHCLMGAVRLRIPQGWRVHVESTPVFGAFQDRTLPITAMAAPVAVLVVRAHVWFAEVTVGN